MMELFDRKFVHFMWDDELEGKEGFFADDICELTNCVYSDSLHFAKVSKSLSPAFPFKDIHNNDWLFFYYDPHYEIKKAVNEGKVVQYLTDKGQWENILSNMELMSHIEKGRQLRVKPEEDERWVVYLRRSKNDEGIYLTSCREDDWKEAKETCNAKTKLFVGSYDEAIKWYDSRQKFTKAIEAFEDGKAIQYYYNPDEEWVDVEETPAWDVNTEYRIKPEEEEEKHKRIEERASKFGEVCVRPEYDDEKCKKCNECIEGPDYRPFKDCDELIEFWSLNYQSVMRPANTKPFIWVRLKVDKRERLIVAFGTDFVEIGNKAKAVNLQKLFEDYEFLDGAVCGVKND